MFRNMKCVLLVVIILALVMNETEAAKKNKKNVKTLKNKQYQEKPGRVVPKEVKLEAKEGRKLKKEFDSAEKTNYGEVKESRLKEKVKPDDIRGKQQHRGKRQYGGGKQQHGQSVTMEKKKVITKPKKLELLRHGSNEELVEEKVIEEKPKLSHTEENYEPELLEEDQEYTEEIEEDILETVDECLDSKCRAKTSRNYEAKTKESILIEEDIDGKCYYEL